MPNPPFLDPEPISDPADDVFPLVDEDESPNGTMPAVLPEPKMGPCDDCARYAQIGYVVGVVIGVAAGSAVAYVILRNRLAPVA